MKICYIADSASIHVIEWSKYFAQLGHTVSVITDSDAIVEGTTTYNIGDCLNRYRIPIITALRQIQRKVKKIKQLLREIQPDLIHAHYTTNNGFLAALTGYHPFILTCHGSDILVDLERNLSESFFVKYALKKADLITLPSQPMADIVSSLGIPPEKIKILQYGIDTDKFSFRPKPQEPVRLVSTRLLLKKYRVDVLIDAALIVLKKFPKLKFDIVGDGSEKEFLERKVSDNNQQNTVHFYGNISHSEINEFYQNAHLYVTTSPTDGLSISLLEAFACGCYPVAPDNSSNSTLYQSGFRLSLFQTNNAHNLAEKIISAVSNLNEFEKDILVNRRLIELNYSKKIAFAKVESLYKEFDHE
jgi:glycosyltransferase involved in cell wall biosynthesis